MEYFIIFIFGAIIGSFLNVCAYRIPRGKSIVQPRSFCPGCKQPIQWFDNVPLISFLVLRGRCRHCGGRISGRYFLVELLTPLSGIILLYYFSMTGAFFVYWIFVCMLIAIVFIDIEHHLIPDVLSVTGMVLGLILVPIFVENPEILRKEAFLDSFFGILVGGGSMFLLGFFGELIFRREALGGGDVKLMGMIGAFLGWKLTLLSFFIAPVFGAGVGLYVKLRKGKDIIPYAPFLALGAIISMLWGDKILEYLFIK